MKQMLITVMSIAASQQFCQFFARKFWLYVCFDFGHEKPAATGEIDHTKLTMCDEVYLKSIDKETQTWVLTLNSAYTTN